MLFRPDIAPENTFNVGWTYTKNKSNFSAPYNPFKLFNFIGNFLGYARVSASFFFVIFCSTFYRTNPISNMIPFVNKLGTAIRTCFRCFGFSVACSRTFRMQNCVRFLCHDNKIFDTIIRLVPINMMHTFFTRKRSFQKIAHNQATSFYISTFACIGVIFCFYKYVLHHFQISFIVCYDSNMGHILLSRGKMLCYS